MKVSSAALSLLALASNQSFSTLAFAPIATNLPVRTTLTLSTRPAFPTTRPAASATTRLDMAVQEGKEQNESNNSRGPRVNLGLVASQTANQVLIGSTIFTGGLSYQVLTHHASFDPSGVALGILGLIPLLAFSNKVETSESPLVAGLNLSTNAALLRMFGNTRQPVVAFGVSAFLAGLTGLVEETLFRGQLMPVLTEWSKQSMSLDAGSGVFFGAAVSTLIFAALHANLTSLFRGKEAIQENLVLLAFQMVTGAIFASLYLATGNLAVPIVAHALYDFVTFYKTHLDVTGQIQYAAQERLMPSAEYDVEKKWEEERGESFVSDARELFYLMDKNQDGVLSRKEFRVALFKYGINLSKEDSETVTETADLDGSSFIDFGEFLEFVGPQGTTEKAVKYAIVGAV